MAAWACAASTPLRPRDAMLEAALYRPADGRFEQHAVSARGVVVMVGDDAWRLVEPPADGLSGPWIELRHTRGEIVARASAGTRGIELLEGPTRRPLHARERTPAPAMLAWGDLLIDMGSRTPANWRPMTRLERRQEARGAAVDPAVGNGPAPATLTRWFEAIATLSRWSVDSEEFWQTVARTVVEPLGFDLGYVVRRDAAGEAAVWRVVAAHLATPELGLRLDRTRLAILDDSDTAWFDNEPQADGSAWAMAPWRDAAGAVAGAVIGVRRVHAGNERTAVRHLEANLVRLLAETITASEVRRQHEQRATRRRGLLELAFSRPVAERIEQDADLLQGARREVSVLFADLRDFSRRFHREKDGGLGAVAAYELLNEVMETLTAVVLKRDGHLIDYYGDGLAAMWNAPLDQINHVALACDAALACAAALEPIDAAWRQRLGGPLRLGVGVNTGAALVGNVGSRLRIKYGARGETVNLASRVERATKVLGVSPIVTSTVAQRLEHAGDRTFDTLRLCRARLAGIEQATDLYLLHPTQSACWVGATPENYSSALASFEAGRLEAAYRVVRDAAAGTPAAFLAERIQQAKDARRGRRAGDQFADTSPIISLVDV